MDRGIRKVLRVNNDEITAAARKLCIALAMRAYTARGVVTAAELTPLVGAAWLREGMKDVPTQQEVQEILDESRGM